MSPPPTPRPEGTAERLMPVAFVLLWSTGFIGSGIAVQHAEPATFVALRMITAAVLVGLTLLIWREALPGWRAAGHAAVAGILMHGLYLTAITWSAFTGMPVAVAALITGLQPLLTGVLAAPLLGERVVMRQWFGLVLGFAGVVMVLWERLGFGEVPVAGVVASLIALAGMTLGTLYQKRFGGGTALRGSTFVQYAASAAVLAPVAFAFETRRVEWTPEMIATFVWLNTALSLGAVGLLLAMIRRGQATRVASLFYLVPCVTAVLAWAFFGNHLGAVALAGMAVAVGGVALAGGGEAASGGAAEKPAAAASFAGPPAGTLPAALSRWRLLRPSGETIVGLLFIAGVAFAVMHALLSRGR